MYKIEFEYDKDYCACIPYIHGSWKWIQEQGKPVKLRYYNFNFLWFTVFFIQEKETKWK